MTRLAVLCKRYGGGMKGARFPPGKRCVISLNESAGGGGQTERREFQLVKGKYRRGVEDQSRTREPNRVIIRYIDEYRDAEKERD